MDDRLIIPNCSKVPGHIIEGQTFGLKYFDETKLNGTLRDVIGYLIKYSEEFEDNAKIHLHYGFGGLPFIEGLIKDGK